MDRVEIIGVGIDNVSYQEAAEKINEFLHSRHQHYVVTPNPEFLVAAQADSTFRQILNYADLAIADGVGLVHAARWLGRRLQRTTGVDLFWNLCELAQREVMPIFLLGGGEDVAAATATVLTKYFPKLIVSGTESGGAVSAEGNSTDDGALIATINQAKPVLLFVAFGHPKQEKWIFRHLDQLPSVKVAMGVGGSFNFISGHVTRAPEVLRSLGLEWLYRLLKEPWRWQRIWTAVVIFPILVLKQKIVKKLI